MKTITIGKIVNAVGIKGEVKVYNYSDGIEIYQRTKEMLMDKTPVRIQQVRTQKNMVILKLEGIDTRNDAEAVKGKFLFITEEDLPELPEGQFYVRDIVGMEVREEDGTLLGRISDVIQNTGQTLFEVKKENGEIFLIPKVDEFVRNIDGEKREITVRLIEGMLEL